MNRAFLSNRAFRRTRSSALDAPLPAPSPGRVLLAAFPLAGPLPSTASAAQARELGLMVPIFGGDGWESSELAAIGGDAVEGTYFSTHFSPEEKRPDVEKFVQDFQAKYGITPDAMAALGYDSAMILADAIKRAGSAEGPKVRDALAATKHFAGITGDITIDDHRDASKPLVILQVKGGKFHLVENISAD